MDPEKTDTNWRLRGAVVLEWLRQHPITTAAGAGILLGLVLPHVARWVWG